MSMRDIEREILMELKQVTGMNKLRIKDIQEWSTGPVKQVDGESVLNLPRLAINVAVKTECLGKKIKA